MTATASGIAAGDLTTRIPEGVSGTEAGELGTALNQMLDRIEDAFDERTRSEERLRRFVGDASHELRTPVTTIRGYAELYRTGALDDAGELREAMRRTEQEAIRMGTLVDDLLLLARLDEGRPLEHEPVDLTLLAEDAARDARAVDSDRPLTRRHPASRPACSVTTVDCVKWSPTSCGTRWCTPRPRRRSRSQSTVSTGTPCWRCATNGPGMPDEVATKVFERFYRADPSRARSSGGSGLGLAIVQATIRAHGGRVALDTEPGRGTTVRIELPLAPSS